MPEDAFAVHDRVLTIATDDAFVREFLRSSYARARQDPSLPVPARRQVDRGEILLHAQPPAIHINGEDVAWPAEAGAERSAFVVAFYGARELFRLSASRVESCRPLYGAAVVIEGRALAIFGSSGSGKTALVLEFLTRGAKLLSDECIFIDRSTLVTSGLPRALMIGESMLDSGLLTLGDRIRQATACSPDHTNPGGRLFYAVEPERIFGPDVMAASAPLGALAMLAGERSALPTLRPISSHMAAIEIGRRSHQKMSSLDDVTELARRLEGLPAFSVVSSGPAATAELLLRACRAA